MARTRSAAFARPECYHRELVQHEWQGSDGPRYGNVATLEAAKQAFRAAWDRGPAHKKTRPLNLGRVGGLAPLDKGDRGIRGMGVCPYLLLLV